MSAPRRCQRCWAILWRGWFRWADSNGSVRCPLAPYEHHIARRSS